MRVLQSVLHLYQDESSDNRYCSVANLVPRVSHLAAPWGEPHRGQTSEHAREITRGSHRSIRKTLHVAVTTAVSSCELEAKYPFYFNEVHRR